MTSRIAACTARVPLSNGLAYLVVAGCALLASPARATEVHAGVRVGAVQIGVDPRLAVSPFAGALWRSESGFLLELSNTFTLSPGDKWGVYDRSAAALGYGWPTGHVSVGPALSLYSMPACNFVICDRVNGIAVGGHAVLAYFFAGPFGLSMTGSLDYVGGKSRVLPGGAVVMGTAGLVVKFETSRSR
ncbi:MAG: hypothetical protein R3F14_10855 [Polyangiaceae bacterium]